MTTALAIRTEGMEPRDLAEARDFSKLVASSSLLPQALRNKPEDVFVIVVSGHELGLSPMQAIRSISVIQGKPVLDAALMVALVKRQRDVCEYFTLLDSSPTRAIYETKRVGEPKPTAMAYTIEEAKAAGLASKDNWQKHAAAMLRARASSALARAVYPDLVLGVYTGDEAEEFTPPTNVRQLARPAEPVQDAVVEPAPSTLEVQLEASIDDAKRKKGAVPLDSDFEAMNKRLCAIPGYTGDENKERRKGWMADAMRYQGAPGRLYQAFTKLDAETKAYVFAQLTKLEEAVQDDVPEFVREPGEEG